MAAVAMPDTVFVGFDFFKQLFFFQGLDDGLAGFKTVQTRKTPGLIRHFPIVSDHFYSGQVVTHSDIKIIGVMGRCYL